MIDYNYNTYNLLNRMTGATITTTGAAFMLTENILEPEGSIIASKRFEYPFKLNGYNGAAHCGRKNLRFKEHVGFVNESSIDSLWNI